MYKGQLEGFPNEVVEKMLERQVEQGRNRDVSVFESYKDANIKGFDWSKSPEEWYFWSEVIALKNFDLFFKRYPKQTYPKVMEVSNYSDFKTFEVRVVFMEKNGMYLAWNYAKTMEEAENTVAITSWTYARDINIQPQKEVELTIEEIGKRLNIDPTLIRIKDK